MIPHVKNITVRRGDTKEILVRVRSRTWNGTEYEPGPYRDLTGYTILAQVRENNDAPVVLLEFDVAMADQADLVNGRGAILLKISDEDTATVPLTVSAGVYDVQFTEPDGDTFTYIEGTVTFKKDVSRV